MSERDTSERVCTVVRVEHPEDCCVCSSVFRMITDQEEIEEYKANPASLLGTLFFTGMMHGVMSDCFHLCKQHEAVWNELMRAGGAAQVGGDASRAAARAPKRARR